MKNKILLIIFFVIAWNYNSESQILNLQQDFNRVAQTVKPSVVAITASSNSAGTPGSIPNQQKIGSGVIFDNRGYILTNCHVIDQAKSIKVKVSSGKYYEAQLINSDANKDLAILKITANELLSAVQIGNSDNVKIGDWVVAIGSTFGLGQTVTAGIISAKSRDLNISGRVYQGLIQTDASINQGNSGGPLIDINGTVVGINTAIYSPDGVFSGMSFAIPINQAVNFINMTLGNMQNTMQVTPSQGAAQQAVFFQQAAFVQQIPFAVPNQAATKLVKVEYLLCPNCQIKLDKTAGIPWTNAKCPGCGTIMAHMIEEKNAAQTSNLTANQAVFQCPGVNFNSPVRAPQAPAQQAAGCATCPQAPICGQAVALPKKLSPGDPCPYCGRPLDNNLRCPNRECPWNFQNNNSRQFPSQQAAGCPAPICGQPVALPQNTQNQLPAANVILVAGNKQNGPSLGISMIQTDSGLQVEEVLLNSTAEKGGIICGDIIFKINDKKIKDIIDFDKKMGNIKIGKRVRFEVIRQNTRKIIYIKT